jgi:putative FmdB family regulatory protein
MPVYEHQCKKCKKVNEFLYPISGPDFKLSCQKCGSEELIKLVSHSYGRVKGTQTPTPN